MLEINFRTFDQNQYSSFRFIREPTHDAGSNVDATRDTTVFPMSISITPPSLNPIQSRYKTLPWGSSILLIFNFQIPTSIRNYFNLTRQKIIR
ncbi:hypothetical protein L1887_01756 [Cichorium endivia]|nr:hypothetical protein L1887_01756 [Cichorium endivia]